jgi:hypothetical protein
MLVLIDGVASLHARVSITASAPAVTIPMEPDLSCQPVRIVMSSWQIEGEMETDGPAGNGGAGDPAVVSTGRRAWLARRTFDGG